MRFRPPTMLENILLALGLLLFFFLAIAPLLAAMDPNIVVK